MRSALVAAVVAAVLTGPSTVGGQPYVQVRARAFLDGLQASARGAEVRVEGALRDNLGAPVAGVELEVIADGEPIARMTTTADGRFETDFELDGAGERRIEVRWAGSALLDAARATMPVTVGRNALRLESFLPDDMPVGRPFDITATALDSRDVTVPRLRLAFELDGVELRTLRTDREGRARVSAPGLTQGAHTVRISFEGNAIHLPAEVTHEIEATRPLAVRLDPTTTTPLGPGDPIVLDATVGRESPDGVRLTLTADGRPLEDRRATGPVTRFAIDADDVKSGPVAFRVVAHSDEPGWKDALSPVLTIDVPPPPPPSPWWIRAPMLLAAASLFAVLLRIRRRPQAAAPPPESAPSGPPPFTFEPVVGRRSDGRLDVIVRDGLTARPLEATLVMLAPGAPDPVPGRPEAPPGESTRVPPEGRAELMMSDPDGGRLWAHTPGYAPTCHPVPAGGGRAVINLLPVRARMQTLYAELLTAAGRPPLRFGRQTPREAALAMSTRGAPSEALERFTTMVEGACFGARVPDERDLTRAFELADDVRRGLGGAA